MNKTSLIECIPPVTINRPPCPRAFTSACSQAIVFGTVISWSASSFSLNVAFNKLASYPARSRARVAILFAAWIAQYNLSVLSSSPSDLRTCLSERQFRVILPFLVAAPIRDHAPSHRFGLKPSSNAPTSMWHPVSGSIPPNKGNPTNLGPRERLTSASNRAATISSRLTLNCVLNGP